LRKYPAKHHPIYINEKKLDIVLNKLKTFSPLVFAVETRHLKNQLSEVIDRKGTSYRSYIIKGLL
jgi:3-deoxy-7-phosphoheptulonate synthase